MWWFTLMIMRSILNLQRLWCCVLFYLVHNCIDATWVILQLDKCPVQEQEIKKKLIDPHLWTNKNIFFWKVFTPCYPTLNKEEWEGGGWFFSMVCTRAMMVIQEFTFSLIAEPNKKHNIVYWSSLEFGRKQLCKPLFGTLLTFVALAAKLAAQSPVTKGGGISYISAWLTGSLCS